MTRISIYIIGQIIPWIVLALIGTALIFLTSQLLRVASVFVGAGAGFYETAAALGLLLVPVIGWALTPAFVVAVFAAAGRMARDGELTALDASGVGRRKLWGGAVALAAMCALVSAWLWLDAAPRSQGILRSIAMDLAGRAIAGKITPGRFIEPIEGLTFFSDVKKDDGTYQGILLEDARDENRPVQFVASEARLTVHSRWRQLTVHLERGTAFFTSPAKGGSRTVLSFEDFDLIVPFGAHLDRRLEFLPALLAVPTSRLAKAPPLGVSKTQWGFALWRRIAGPLGFIALAIVAILLAFNTTWESRGVALALATALFLAYHLLCRIGESLMQADLMGPRLAALGPAGIMAGILFVLLLYPFLCARLSIRD
jgi:lipopolysaccharide export LptBFGC system permease protein LptF